MWRNGKMAFATMSYTFTAKPSDYHAWGSLFGTDGIIPAFDLPEGMSHYVATLTGIDANFSAIMGTYSRATETKTGVYGLTRATVPSASDTYRVDYLAYALG